MGERLDALVRDLESSLQGARSDDDVRARAARIVGKKGELTALEKRIREVPPEDRRELGRRINEAKARADRIVEARLAALRAEARRRELEGPALDVTLPGRPRRIGSLHPVRQCEEELLDALQALGFEVADGPEIETTAFNFWKLGFAPDHPATCMQDSFYLRDDVLLRTHTSPIQVREMLSHPPPVRIAAPGTVYRRDDDVTHSPMFHQIEGLLVDEDVTFADMKGILTLFVRRVFGPDTPVRLRPSYFPFTEPSGEIDIGCLICSGRKVGCRVCKGTGWLEVGGCGMVHPVVFENVGYDPERFSGFAFGMGVDRIAMLRFGIGDIRLLYENDVRFLRQF
ncbi:MAG: phenylalanine--tRNA ligase subunit alpha [Deltaproteobacteria bacterium]|nr:phenylalanine--tRNA ligase subunit alpha [Deltaproteobacteria bacterium]